MSTRDARAAWVRAWGPPLVTLASLAVALGAVLGAEGDAFRVIREQLLASDAVQLGAVAFASWALLFAIGRGTLRSRVPSRLWRASHAALAVLIGGVGLVLLARSLQWGLRLDAQMVLYPARLVVTGQRVPYLELVEFNQPATYAVYGALDQLIGSERGLRLVDALLVVIATLAARDAMRLGTYASAAMAGGLFVATHLQHAGVDGLQREMFLLAFSLCAGAAIARDRWIAAGLLAALVLWMKPHGVLLIVPFAWARLRRPDLPRRALRGLATSGAVALACSALVIASLAAVGALGAWWEIVSEYLPLYGRMAGTWTFAGSTEGVWIRRLWLFFHPVEHRAVLGLLLVPPLLLLARRRDTTSGDAAPIVTGSYFAGLAYTMIQGTFWSYQSIPTMFAIGAMFAVLLHHAPNALERLGALALIAAVAWGVHRPATLLELDWESSGRNEDAVALAQALRTELPPGETVQPLETVTGVVDAMWRADVPLATSFVFDVLFYHHVDRPVIVGYRRRFLRELETARPLFLIEPVGGYRLRAHGAGTSEAFPELDAWVRANYVVDRERDGFRWWRRR